MNRSTGEYGTKWLLFNHNKTQQSVTTVWGSFHISIYNQYNDLYIRTYLIFTMDKFISMRGMNRSCNTNHTCLWLVSLWFYGWGCEMLHTLGNISLDACQTNLYVAYWFGPWVNLAGNFPRINTTAKHQGHCYVKSRQKHSITPLPVNVSRSSHL